MSDTLETIETPEIPIPEIPEAKPPFLTSNDVGKTIATTLIQVAVLTTVTLVGKALTPKIQEIRENRRAEKAKKANAKPKLQNVS